jgi:hypothetical protein
VEIGLSDIILMLLSGLPVLLATVKHTLSNKIGPIIGLFVTQPTWIVYAYSTDSMGLMPTVLMFSLVYANGIYQQWRK